MIISISNHKGGVGKTTSTINIGAALHKLGHKVLIVDLDAQANLTHSLGLENEEKNIYKTLTEQVDITPLQYKENFDIIASTLDMSAIDIELSGEAGREFILKERLSKIKDKYDYILLDTPPSLGLLTINAFTASDKILIPLQAEYLALQGLKKLSDVIVTPCDFRCSIFCRLLRVAIICSGKKALFFIKPSAIAIPKFPAPIMAIFFILWR